MFKSFAEKLPVSSKSAPGSGRSPRGQDPEPPAPVQRAVRLMLIGAAVSTVYLILSVLGSFSLKSEMMSANAEKLKLHQITEGQISSAATALIIYTIVAGLVSIGLWLWMAKMNGAGRNWARITASALFLLWTYYTYVSIGSTRGAATLLISMAIVLVTWLIGLATLYLLWRPASSAYFKAQSSR